MSCKEEKGLLAKPRTLEVVGLRHLLGFRLLRGGFMPREHLVRVLAAVAPQRARHEAVDYGGGRRQAVAQSKGEHEQRRQLRVVLVIAAHSIARLLNRSHHNITTQQSLSI